MGAGYLAYAVFLIREVGLGPFELVLIGTVLEGTILVLEVPTGVVADTVSRRLSVLIGLGLLGVGTLVMAGAGSFTIAVVSSFVSGVGFTFISGANVAWITDEVGEEQATQLYLRSAELAPLGTLVGLGIGVGLAEIDLALPIVFMGVTLLFLTAFLALTMPETGFVRPEKRSGFGRTGAHTFRTALRGARGRPVVLLLLGVAIFHGAATESYDRLYELHLLLGVGLPPLAGLGPVAWFGLISAVGLGIAYVITRTVRRRIRTADPRFVPRLLVVVEVAMVVAGVAFALAPNLALALAAVWFGSVLRRLRVPLTAAWLNRGLDPSTRATVNSLAGQADAFGQLAGGPLLGALASLRSVVAALVVGSVIRLPAAALLARASSSAGQEEKSDSEANFGG